MYSRERQIEYIMYEPRDIRLSYILEGKFSANCSH
jgi:hypothetical protein